jgi:PadR family transcriptional regulator PadR
VSQQNGSSERGTESLHLPGQPRNFLRPCLLLLLGEEPAYGYQLRDKLAPMSPGHWDQGNVYRTLNTMEEDGLVASSWERSAEGPRRRRYDITEMGTTVLEAWVHELSGVRDQIAGFVRRYQHHMGNAATPAPEPVRPPAASPAMAPLPQPSSPNGLHHTS